MRKDASSTYRTKKQAAIQNLPNGFKKAIRVNLIVHIFLECSNDIFC